ncbi:MAG TPA: serine hydrolase [Longimicrobium sp.]|nr:serine hydrolase [Longimicrobium sp.]
MRIHAITLPLILAAAAPLAAQTTPPLGAPPLPVQAASHIDEHMRRLVPFGFSGAVLVAYRGSVLLDRGYGMADAEKSLAATPETVFYIGSIAKQFTAAAILKLEAEGRLSVTDRISRFFPQAPADKAGITLHQVLTHTAGLPEYMPGRDDQPLERDAAVRWILAEPLIGPVGGEFAYSNAGYTLLAAVVEVVSGTGYEPFLREKFFLPAGMLHTGRVLPDWSGSTVAVGSNGGRRMAPPLERPAMADGPSWNVRGAGGLMSTTGDLLRWAQALHGGRLLPAAQLAKMTTGGVRLDPGGRNLAGYGGVKVTFPDGRRAFGIAGGDGTFNAILTHYADGYVVVAASNVGERPVESQGRVLNALLFGGPYQAPPVAAQVDPAALAGLAGTYRLPTGGTVRLAADGGRVRMTAEGQDALDALAARPLPADRSAGLNARAREMLEAAERGDFAPLHAAFGGQVPLEEVRQAHTRFTDAMEQELGALQGIDVVGSVDAGELVRTLVRYRLERGTRLLRMGWAGGALAGMQPVRDLPATTVVPVAPGELAAYDFMTGRTQRLRIRGAALVIDTASGEVAAAREG